MSVSARLSLMLALLLPIMAKADSGMAEGLPARLTATPGDPARGEEIIRDTARASCLICHTISIMPDRDQGTLGPSLDGTASRHSEAALRQRIVDARIVSAETIMPPYYSDEGLFRVGERWAQGTIYSAQDVEDVVAFLMTLEE